MYCSNLYLDGTYPNDHDLYWVIDAPNYVDRIEIKIIDIDLEEASDAYISCFDYITINDSGKC